MGLVFGAIAVAVWAGDCRAVDGQSLDVLLPSVQGRPRALAGPLRCFKNKPVITNEVMSWVRLPHAKLPEEVAPTSVLPALRLHPEQGSDKPTGKPPGLP